MESIDNNKFSFVDNKLFANVNGAKHEISNLSNIHSLKEINTLKAEAMKEKNILLNILKKTSDETEKEYLNKKLADNKERISSIDKQFADELSRQTSMDTREADKIGDDMYVLKPFIAFIESFIKSDKGAFSKNKINNEKLEFTATPEETNKLLEKIEENKPISEVIKSLIPTERIKENRLELPSTESNNMPDMLSDRSLLIMIDNNIFPAMDQKSLNNLLSNGDFVNKLSKSNNAKVFALDKETLMNEFSNLTLSEDKEKYIKDNLKAELLKEFTKPTQYQQNRFIPEDKLDISSFTKLGINVKSIPQSDIKTLRSGDEIKVKIYPSSNEEAEANIRLEMNEEGMFVCKVTKKESINKFTLYNHKFTEDEKNQLKNFGQLTNGPITVIDNGVSKDILPFYKDGVLGYRIPDKIGLPQKYNGVEINKEQKELLQNGKTVVMKGLVDKDGTKYDGYVRFNLVKNKLESINLLKETLSEKQTFKPKFKM